MFEEDSRPVNSLLSLPLRLLGFAEGPWGTVEASLVYVTGDVEEVGYHPTSPIEYLRNFMTLPHHRPESRTRNFLPISSPGKSPFFLIRHVFPVFSSSIPSWQSVSWKRGLARKISSDISRQPSTRILAHDASLALRSLVIHKGL